MIFHKNLIWKKIGLDFIFENLKLCSPFSKSIIKQIKPYSIDQVNQLKIELSNLSEIHISYKNTPLKYNKVCNILKKFKEVRGTITKLATSQILDVVDLYNLKFFSYVNQEFVDAFNQLDLKIVNIQIHSLHSIFDLLDPKNQNQPTFSIYNQYSKVLHNLRLEKLELESQISQSNSQTQKELRFERRTQIVQQEQTEELRIRENLTKEIKKLSNLLNDCAQSIGKIDFLIAKAKIASEFNAIMPIFNDKDEFEVIDMNKLMRKLIKKELLILIRTEPLTTLTTLKDLNLLLPRWKR